MSKRKRMSVLVEFVPPDGAEFSDIRDFITDWLESGGGCRHPEDPLFHSLADVHVSKPIKAWRDPAKKAKPPLRVVTYPRSA